MLTLNRSSGLLACVGAGLLMVSGCGKQPESGNQSPTPPPASGPSKANVTPSQPNVSDTKPQPEVESTSKATAKAADVEAARARIDALGTRVGQSCVEQLRI